MTKLIGWMLVAVLVAMAMPAGAQTVRYIHTDALGTPVAKTDANRNVIERNEYEPFGAQLAGPNDDGPGYTGHVQDAATGLTYMQQRYYDPGIGMFLSVDPVSAYDSGDMRFFNRYAYAFNNPYKFNDPDGRFAILAAPLVPPALVALGKAAAYTGAILGGLYLGDKISDQIQQSQGKSPPLPTDLVGTDDGKGGQQGGRVNNGPLTPENGGSGGDDESDFGQLTGGRIGPAPTDKGYPAGTRVGENGISHRPATGRDGPRIDIPANGDKPHETLHYPKPLPPEKNP